EVPLRRAPHTRFHPDGRAGVPRPVAPGGSALQQDPSADLRPPVRLRRGQELGAGPLGDVQARPSRSVSSIAAAPGASSSTAVGAPPVSPASSAPSGSTASAAPSGSPSRAAGSGPGPSSRWVKARARTRPPGSSSQAQAYKGGSSAPIDGTASPSTSA